MLSPEIASRRPLLTELLAVEVAATQADANRWTAWYNLQLARLDVLRSTELLFDYIEKSRGVKRSSGPSPVEPPPAQLPPPHMEARP